MAKQVKIYTTPSCVYCIKTKDFFKANNIQYQEIDVLKDENGREEMLNQTGKMAVPVIDIDGEIIVGFNEPALKKALQL